MRERVREREREREQEREEESCEANVHKIYNLQFSKYIR